MASLPNRHARSGGPKTHQPGSIVRVTLTNFVTYTKAEFNPGPNLNMVIGPNGTGKSTLVCAICIGLGWSTKHLGRGKNLDEFVKHGAKKGQIEIELAADPTRHESNPVITTRIKKGDATNGEYLIDGKKENKKRVQELARSFSIQVDNLCQFLPQDRVVEFAGLSPVDLLTETQRAAAPQQMCDWHEQLKGWRKEQKQQQVEQQSLAEIIKRQEDRQRLQEADVQRLRDRAQLQDRRNALEKMRVLPEYRETKDRWTQAKERRKEAGKELTQLQHRMEPSLAAVKAKEEYVAMIRKPLPGRQKLVKRVEGNVDNAKKKITAADDKIKECNNEIEAEVNSMKTVKQSMPTLQRNVSSIEKAKENPPEEFDPASMNEEIRDKTRQIRDLDERTEQVRQEVDSLGQQIGQRTHIVQAARREKENMQSQAGQQMNKLSQFSRDAAKAWEWIQANRGRFQGDVFGPPLVECRVKDERHASAVESLIQMSDALAFTVTTKADFDMLTDQLYGPLKFKEASVRASLKPLDSYRPPASTEALRQYGLEGWLLDLLDGPEPVLAMLCDNRSIHQTAYTFRDITQAQFNALQQSPLTSWVTSKQSYVITRRRDYGDKATSTRVQDLKQARFFTKVAIDHQQESGINRRIAETQSEIEELLETQRAKKQDDRELGVQAGQLKKEKEAIEKDKKTKQSAVSQFNALDTKLENAQSKLNEAKEKLAGSAQRKREIERRHDAICLEKGQHAIDYANAVDSLRGLHIQLFEAEILQIEATSDLEQLKAQHQEEQRLLDERQQEVTRLRAQEGELLAAGRRLQEKCHEITPTFTPEDQQVWEEIQEWNLDQWNTEVVSLTASIESLVGGGNENTLREFEKRAADIETKTRKFNELGTALDVLEAQIANVREQWEPQLDALVEEISDAFAENFSKIQCAGEVGVHKDEDFEDWAIQIKVKFRYVAACICIFLNRADLATTGRTNRCPYSTLTGNLAASAPSAQSSTSWPYNLWPARPSGLWTRSTRAWTHAMSGSCIHAWSTSLAPRPAMAGRVANTSSSRRSCCRGSSIIPI